MQDIYKAPCFVVNMDQCMERLDVVIPRIRDAGFTNVMRFKAVDATTDDLVKAWAAHGSPKFNPTDTEFVEFKGKQGCMLSHLHLWKKIIDEKIPLAVIFEDDVLFHKQWNEIAPIYYDSTPKNWDILYMGSQIDYYIDGYILMTPVFCTHAYVLTYEGAKKLYDLLVQDPNGVWTIDCMLIEHMKDFMFRDKEAKFTWYAWNGTKFIDKAAFADPQWTKRNTGLVFQDSTLGTYVRPY